MSQYSTPECFQEQDAVSGEFSERSSPAHKTLGVPADMDKMARLLSNANSTSRRSISKRFKKASLSAAGNRDELARSLSGNPHPKAADTHAENDVTLRQYWEDDLENISVTAGLLTLASYSLVTSDLSTTNLSAFSPKQVQIFGAWTVALFIGVIVLCQQQKFSLRDEFRNETRAYKDFRYFAAICLRPIIAFMFQAALLLLFLTISAFVWHVGLLFAILDGIWLAWSLMEWTWWFSVTFPRIRRESLRKCDDKGTSKSDQADDAKDKGPHLPTTLGEVVFSVVSSVFRKWSEPDAKQDAEVGHDVP